MATLDHVWWLAPAVMFSGSSVLLGLAYYQSNRPEEPAVAFGTNFILIVSMTMAAFSFGIKWNTQKNITDDVADCVERLKSSIACPSSTVLLKHAPGLSLFFVILVRLCSQQDVFQSHPQELNFGPKFGVYNGEPNISFTPEFNSFGHCIQGVISAAFSFPAVSCILTQIVTLQPLLGDMIAPGITELMYLISSLMSLYPSYNLIKRFIKSGDAFATSSYANNGFEWAAGYVLGMGFGILVSAVVKFQTLRKLEGWAVQETKPQCASCTICSMQIINLLLDILLLLSVFCAALLFGFTWHNCHNGGDQCVNFDENGTPLGILVGLVAIPTFSCGAALFHAKTAGSLPSEQSWQPTRRKRQTNSLLTPNMPLHIEL